jgi:DNA polymerase I-like protein with 3'-5' exonuclease and polymerase domains
MAFSAAAMHAQIAPVERRLTELERRVRVLANQPRLQLSSNAEVAVALFDSAPAGLGFVAPETAKLAPSRSGRKQGQKFSVSAAVLQDLRAADARAAPIVDAILEQRQLAKSVACVPFSCYGRPCVLLSCALLWC